MGKELALTFSLLLLIQELPKRLSASILFPDHVVREDTTVYLLPFPRELIAERGESDSLAVDGTIVASAGQSLQDGVYVVQLKLQHDPGSLGIHRADSA